MKRGFWLLAILIIVFSLQFPTFYPRSCDATVVWSEDFNDGNYEGWTVRTGNFTAEDYTLQANATSGESDIYFNSTIIRGTWNWTVYCSDPEHSSQVFFIHCPLNTSPLHEYINAYSIQIDAENHSFLFLRWKPSATLNWRYNILGSYNPGYPLNGWQQISVMRNVNGYFYIVINGTLRMSRQNRCSACTADIFRFTGQPGCALDNITVSNSQDLLLEPANLQFVDDAISVVCEKGGNPTIARFNVTNHGEKYGSAGFTWINVPMGISPFIGRTGVGLFGNQTESLTVEFELNGFCLPGIYVITLQLWRGESELLDSLPFIITVIGFPLVPFSISPLEALLLGFTLQAIIITIVLLIDFYIRKRKDSLRKST